MKLRQGNVFTSVCQSVHRRGGLCPSMHHRSHVWGVSVWGSLSRVGLCPGVLCLGGSLSRGVSVQGLSVWGSVSRGCLYPGRPYGHRPPPMVTSGWYTSYWNAFLLLVMFLLSCCTTFNRIRSGSAQLSAMLHPEGSSVNSTYFLDTLCNFTCDFLLSLRISDLKCGQVCRKK